MKAKNDGQVLAVSQLLMPNRLLRFAAARNWPYLAGRIMAWSCGRVRSERPRVLIVSPNKDGIVADAEESLGSHFEIIKWPGFILKTCAQAILSDNIGDANSYVSENIEVEDSKRRLRLFLAASWRHLLKRVRIDAVVTANFGFRSEREFASALEEFGTPFIVIQKENLNGITPRRWAFWHRAYRGRGKFTGRKILTYNDVERRLEISSGVVDPTRVVVVGMPRLDRMHRWRKQHAGEGCGKGNTVVFFAFDRRDKIPPDTEIENLTWGQFCEDTHRALFSLAQDNPDFEVIVKSKSQTAQSVDIKAILDGLGHPPQNMQIVIGGDPFDLITDARVVVGFNTTAILEALAAGKPVIVPRFGEALDPALQAFILDLGGAVDYAGSPSDLKSKISAHLRCPINIPTTLKPEVASVLKNWTGNDDGEASARVLDAVWCELQGDVRVSGAPIPSIPANLDSSRIAIEPSFLPRGERG